MTCRYDNIIPVQEKGGRCPMLRTIKKVLANRQARQAQQRRLENNRKQLQLIYKGLIEREY